MANILNSHSDPLKKAIKQLEDYLSPYGAQIKVQGLDIIIKVNSNVLILNITKENVQSLVEPKAFTIPQDYLIASAEKISAFIISKLGLNRRLFARNCFYKIVDKTDAIEFLNRWHLLGTAGAAAYRGLFYKDILVAVASFSKGRKMDRLPSGKLSYELIRFCCYKGVSVLGGLSRLVKNFCLEKEAGDIMTYVDAQLSDGNSFINAGFKKTGFTLPHSFLIDRISFQRIPIKTMPESYDENQFYLTQNSGSIKLIWTPDE
jgi:hypothetical protein